jgi:hypothetical protein
VHRPAVLQHQITAHDAQVGHAIGHVFRNVVVAHEQQLKVKIAAGGKQPLPVAVELQTHRVQQISAL